MAETAEVRAWARANGHDVGVKGAIPKNVQDAYDLAHAPVVDAGVTEADFPPMPDDPIEPDTVLEPGTPAAPAAPRARTRKPVAERRPREVKPPRRNFRDLFGGTTKGKRPKGPRTDLSEFAEDTWRDLALLTSGVMPPVSKVLTIQAPYAGEVFDTAVKGLPLVDTLLQPVARMSVSLRALNGLLGPVVFTAGICLRSEWQTTPDGMPVFGPDGRPVPTQQTALMIGGLKYSLLQMSRTADLDKVRERAEVDAERMRAVDGLVDFILGYPTTQTPAPDDGGGAPAPAPGNDPQAPHGSPGPVLAPTFLYPPSSATAMDDVGSPA